MLAVRAGLARLKLADPSRIDPIAVSYAVVVAGVFAATNAPLLDSAASHAATKGVWVPP